MGGGHLSIEGTKHFIRDLICDLNLFCSSADIRVLMDWLQSVGFSPSSQSDSDGADKSLSLSSVDKCPLVAKCVAALP